MENGKIGDVVAASPRHRLERLVVRFESYQLDWVRKQADKKCVKMSQFIRILVQEAMDHAQSGKESPKVGVAAPVHNPFDPSDTPDIEIDEDF